MPKLQFGTSNIDRDRGNLPELPVINMFVEQYPTEDNVVLQSRPGLANTGTSMGVGPVKRLFQIDGVLSGAMYGVSDNKLYEGSTNRGTINGTGVAYIAGFENRLFVTQGQSVYHWDGATLAAIATPGSVDISALCVGTSRLIVVSKDTGRFYWSNVLSETIDALSFATAENSPDKVKDCLFIADTLLLFGTETVEHWPANSSNPDLPFQPLVGRTFQIGIRGTGCATTFATTFAWITNHNQICVGDPQTVISNSSLDEKLAASTTASLWTFYLDGIEFLACRLDSQTWVFNKASSQWSRFESAGANWIPQCYVNNVFGSSADGALIAWTATHEDFGGVMERRFRAGMSITDGTIPVYQLTLKTATGRTPYTTGSYTNPDIELRRSKDGGETWSSWRTRPMGTQNQFRRNIRWTSLGFFGNPGILVEVRVQGSVPFRVSDMTVNESYASING